MDDQMINMKDLRNNFPVGQPKTNDQSRHLTSTGLFDKLSLELLHMTLEEMTISSLLMYKATNHANRLLVESWPPYHQLTRYGEDALRAMLMTRASDHFTTRQLLNTIHTEECCVCGEFAGFIYTLKCARCCYCCLANERQLLPITVKAAEEILGFDTINAHVPTIKTIERKHFWGQSYPLHNMNMVDYTTTAATSTTIPPDSHQTRPLPTILDKRARRSINNQNPTPFPILPDFRINALEAHPFRYLAFFRFPVLRRPKPSGPTNLEHGRYCLGCCLTHNILGLSTRYETRMYSHDTLPLHLKQCHFAQNLRRNMYEDPMAKVLGRLDFSRNMIAKQRRMGINGQGWESMSGLVLEQHPEHPKVEMHKMLQGNCAGEVEVVEEGEGGCGDEVYHESQAGWCVRGSRDLNMWRNVLEERRMAQRKKGWNFLGLDEL